MIHHVAKAIFASFLLVQLVSSVQYTDRGYTFTTPGPPNDNTQNQYFARGWCNQADTRLLEILTSDIQNATAAFLNYGISNQILSGWETITNAKLASSRGWEWVNGNSIGEISLDKQGNDLSRSFGYLNVSGNSFQISANVPTDRQGYICEGQSFCSSGRTFNGRCFQSSTTKLTWFEARNRCLRDGGDLASFDFIRSNQNLTLLNGTWLTSSSYWVGIRRMFWTWLDSNTEVRYTQWRDGLPVYNGSIGCVCLYPYDWKWSQCNCNTDFQFTCLSVANISTTSTAIGSSSSTTARYSIKTSQTTQSISSNLTSNPAISSPSQFTENVATDPVKKRNDGPPMTYEAALGIGLGVGIGVGLLISAIIVALYIRARRRGWSGNFSSSKSSPLAKMKSDHHANGHAPTYAFVTNTATQPPAPYTQDYVSSIYQNGFECGIPDSPAPQNYTSTPISYAAIEHVQPNQGSNQGEGVTAL